MGVTVTITSHGPQFLQKRISKEQKLDKEGKPIESPHPQKGQVVHIFYHGFLYDSSAPDNKGPKFDSSYDRKEAFKTEIGVGKVIRGWDDGIVQLKEGDKATLLITPDYGYGARGFPPVIPPNSTLIFEVELTEIPDIHKDE
ncbi:peptidyl-prolyl cis-trans isomerase [Mycena albidolilacea]|uniref:peptidylprolyl isomerase n=1 Tax=Mycena albidolilacea TaxID=1033008 RepID=A0AAD6ZLX3_9AGAR|nr:peptidyl-prolyl cis-trans isomerase [Mycena albidolilacea]